MAWAAYIPGEASTMQRDIFLQVELEYSVFFFIKVVNFLKFNMHNNNINNMDLWDLQTIAFCFWRHFAQHSNFFGFGVLLRSDDDWRVLAFECTFIVMKVLFWYKLVSIRAGGWLFGELFCILSGCLREAVSEEEMSVRQPAEVTSITSCSAQSRVQLMKREWGSMKDKTSRRLCNLCPTGLLTLKVL